MLEVLSLVILLAESPTQTTVPRRVETPTAPPPKDQPRTGDGPFEASDPLYDKPHTATDDAAFVLSAVESGRQGVVTARAAESGLSKPELRSAASKIGRQQEATLKKLEALAKIKGWRLPQANPSRASAVPAVSPAQADAAFVVQQIKYHETLLAQYRAQLSGNGDEELKRALRETIPEYQQNLQMLLGLKL